LRSDAHDAGLGAGEVWIFTSKALGSVITDQTALARLSCATVYELVTAGSRRADGIGAGGIRTVPTQVFTSSDELCRTVEAGNLLHGVSAVLYDPERWPFTPPRDQLDPCGSTERVAATARRRGLSVLAAPAMNLSRAMAPASPRSNRDLYLRLGLAGSAARHADVIDIQAQSLIRSPGLYRSFVSDAAAQAKQANPSVVVVSGLSTNPPGLPLSPGVVADAMRASRDLVSGWWMNIPSPGPKCPKCSPSRPDYAIAALGVPETLAGFNVQEARPRKIWR
jgi:hypothetical protein